MHFNMIKSILQDGVSIRRADWENDKYVFMGNDSVLYLYDPSVKSKKKNIRPFNPSLGDLQTDEWTIKR